MTSTMLCAIVLMLMVCATAFKAPFAVRRSALSATTGATATSSRQQTALQMGEVYFENNCEDRLKDKNGRCPGMPGYQPTTPTDSVPSGSFAEFQKAMAEKKRKASDAKGIKK